MIVIAAGGCPDETKIMHVFTTIPWWMALIVGVVCLPVMFVYFIAKLVYEVIDEGIRNSAGR